MRQFPPWSDVKGAMDNVAERTSFDLERNSSKVFDQFGYIKNYCTEEKLSEWRKKKMETEDRWVEIFQHLERAGLPFKEFALIVEFILCLPGSSATVERIFSMAKQKWKIESSALMPSTLNSMLKVDYNMEYDCLQFYEFLKTQTGLLRQISSQDKYGFESTGASTSRMSIDPPQPNVQEES